MTPLNKNYQGMVIGISKHILGKSNVRWKTLLQCDLQIFKFSHIQGNNCCSFLFVKKAKNILENFKLVTFVLNFTKSLVASSFIFLATIVLYIYIENMKAKFFIFLNTCQ